MSELSSYVQIRDAVKTNMSDSSTNKDIFKAVIEQLTRKEVEKRVAAITAGLDKRSDAAKALQRIKPDSVTFDIQGVKHEAYTKATQESLVKARELVDKFDRALEDALVKANYSNLSKLLGDEKSTESPS